MIVKSQLHLTQCLCLKLWINSGISWCVLVCHIFPCMNTSDDCSLTTVIQQDQRINSYMIDLVQEYQVAHGLYLLLRILFYYEFLNVIGTFTQSVSHVL